MCRCVMCRAEAHQLYARKPIFDAMGVQLVVCLNEHNDAEVHIICSAYCFTFNGLDFRWFLFILACVSEGNFADKLIIG